MKKDNFSQFSGAINAEIFGNTKEGIVENEQPSKSVQLVLASTITCPNCGHCKEEIMPTNACQYFYACENCKQVLKPKPGDCCVYCSYGTVQCPPIQAGSKNCC